MMDAQYAFTVVVCMRSPRVPVLSSHLSKKKRCNPAAALSRDRDVQTGAASTSGGVAWDKTEAGTPLEDLPEPDGNFCLPFIGETAELKANHWEWAHKR